MKIVQFLSNREQTNPSRIITFAEADNNVSGVLLCMKVEHDL